jgi:hypothetical protein
MKVTGGLNMHEKEMVILLDLNYTLVSNSKELPYPNCNFARESYRNWLIELIKDRYVILITARMSKYQVGTLENIKAKTGWQPDEAYFNSGLTAPEFKYKILHEKVIHRFEVGRLLAIESNVKTRKMYHLNDVATIKVHPGDLWTELPVGVTTTKKQPKGQRL